MPTGDYLVEALDRNGAPIPGALYVSATYTEAICRAQPLAEAHGADRWRIMRCVSSSTDKERWLAKP